MTNYNMQCVKHLLLLYLVRGLLFAACATGILGLAFTLPLVGLWAALIAIPVFLLGLNAVVCAVERYKRWHSIAGVRTDIGDGEYVYTERVSSKVAVAAYFKGVGVALSGAVVFVAATTMVFFATLNPNPFALVGIALILAISVACFILGAYITYKKFQRTSIDVPIEKGALPGSKLDARHDDEAIRKPPSLHNKNHSSSFAVGGDDLSDDSVTNSYEDYIEGEIPFVDAGKERKATYTIDIKRSESRTHDGPVTHLVKATKESITVILKPQDKFPGGRS